LVQKLYLKEDIVMRRPLRLLTGAVLILGNATSAFAGNVVTRWVEEALDVVRTSVPSISTPAAGRLYAMTTVSMYDAVNGIDRARHLSTREHALVSPQGAPFWGDRRAAAAAAAHAVLSALVPAQTDILNMALAAGLAAFGGEGNVFVAAGRDWGRAVGLQVVTFRSNDGTQTSETQPPGSGPGEFPRPFSGSQFRNLTPFGVGSIDPYASPGPPALTGAEYAAAFNEVKALGNITDADQDRAEIARQWLAEGGTARETGLWFKAAINIVEDQGTDLSLSQTARLFALLGMGIADSVATSWAAKFDFHFWRPGDAIRAADTDGNPATEQDPNWAPRASGAPPANFGGTPEHTSGTSTFAGAAAAILAGFYCGDDITFSFEAEGENPTWRSYHSFSEAADEAGRSRIYGGIHFEFSNQSGREAGEGIGTEIVTTRLRRAGSCHGITCRCPQF
jgi:hypothetical protein